MVLGRDGASETRYAEANQGNVSYRVFGRGDSLHNAQQDLLASLAPGGEVSWVCG
jgi:hypothetical protein